MRTAELWAFIQERHNIYLKKQAGLPKPWTQDKILGSYRFCNVYRELDSVTIWIHENWRYQHRNDPDLWFAMVVARLINWPESLLAMGYPIPYDSARFIDTIHDRQARGFKAFSGAYIVSTNGHAMDKAEYLDKYVLQPLWESREELRPMEGESLASYFEDLSRFNGMGSFMAGQVIADVKYAGCLFSAPDWWVWAASGPGSRRGLNRVTSRPTDASWPGASWHSTLMELKAEIDPRVSLAGMPEIHAQDLQNCLCEFDKYERTRLGEGRPRSSYPGGL
jgi:hypothetical protein